MSKGHSVAVVVTGAGSLGAGTHVQEAIAAVTMSARGDHNWHPCWCHGPLNATQIVSGAGCSVAALDGESDVRSNIHCSTSHRRMDSDAKP